MRFDTVMEAIEETGSPKPFYAQFHSVVPELGKRYKDVKDLIQHTWKVVYIGYGVALAVCVDDDNGGHNIGNKKLFNSEGIMTGWVYGDSRSVYRLIEEVAG